MSKRSIITGLVGLNLFLLMALLFSTYSMPAALAQRSGASSNMVAITCRADKDYDALYLTDLGERKLHCFVPNRNRDGSVIYAGSRDLAVDFNR